MIARSLKFVAVLCVAAAPLSQVRSQGLPSVRVAAAASDSPDAAPDLDAENVAILIMAQGGADGQGFNPGAFHIDDAERNLHFPIIPEHEIVGRIDGIGARVERLRTGGRVGIPWLGHTCGACSCCTGGWEDLDRPHFSGHTRDGGFATSTIAEARFAFPLGRGLRAGASWLHRFPGREAASIPPRSAGALRPPPL